jgi:hypothetical protein
MLGPVRKLGVGALVAVALALAGCGGSHSTSTTNARTTQQASPPQESSTPGVAVRLPQLLPTSSTNPQFPTCTAVVADWNAARSALLALAASNTPANLNAAIDITERLSADFKNLVQDIGPQDPGSSSIVTYDHASSFFFMVGSVFAGLRNHYVPTILETTASQQEPTVVPSAEAAVTSDCLGG